MNIDGNIETHIIDLIVQADDATKNIHSYYAVMI